MNDDYLWNKTGEDAEIERLEDALKAFRYEEIAPPALPAKVLPFIKKEPSRRVFPLAIAASAAFVMISLGVWFQVSSNKTEVASELPTIAKQNEFADNPLVKEPPVINIETPKQSVRRNFIKPKKAAIAHRRVTAQKNKNAEAIANLTKEERYAYNQLMTALSITSSKLKIVKDRVEGVELSKALPGDKR